jgi:hypothetical protein
LVHRRRSKARVNEQRMTPPLGPLNTPHTCASSDDDSLVPLRNRPSPWWPGLRVTLVPPYKNTVILLRLPRCPSRLRALVLRNRRKEQRPTVQANVLHVFHLACCVSCLATEQRRETEVMFLHAATNNARCW